MTKANRPQRVEAEQFEDTLTAAIARVEQARELTKEEVDMVSGGATLTGGISVTKLPIPIVVGFLPIDIPTLPNVPTIETF